MKKIISLFKRNYDGDRLVRDEIVPGAEWVITGEGVATVKFDGTCCKIESGKLFRRYDAKRGRTPPYGFVPAQEPDSITGHWPGWIEVGDRPEDIWHRPFAEIAATFPDGTYEFIGPTINGNPEHTELFYLIRHGDQIMEDCPRTFSELRQWFIGKDIEGIVWHHADGRMVKIKKKDFGLKRSD